MKGMFKRALAGVAAAALAVTGFALGAGAANAAPTENAYITLTGTDVAAEREFYAYKLGDYTDAEYSEADGLTSVGVATDGDWTTALKAAIGAANLTADYEASVYNGNPAAYVASLDTTEDGAALRAIAESLAESAKSATADFGPLTASDNTVTVPVTDDGLYLITDSEGSPIIVGSPVEYAAGQYENEIGAQDEKVTLGEAVLKPNSGPDVDKSVTGATEDPVISFDGDTVYVGQTLTYTVSTNVPNTTGYSQTDPYQLVITDTADAGLTINGIQSVTLNGTPLTKDTDYTVGSATTEDDKTVTTVTIKNVAGKDGQEVVVTYSATVNGTVLEGAINNTAQAGHDSDHFGQGDKVTVYTYQFDFTKKDSDGNALKDAGFVVKRGDAYLKQDPDTKVWSVASGQADATVFYSGEDGKVLVQGLPEGEYTVEETVVPDGFMSSVKPSFTVTITDKDENGEYDGQYTVVLGKDAWGLVDTGNKVVKNVKNVTELPLTGAAGTMLFTVLGLLIAGAGALVYMKSRSVKHMLRG